MPEPVNIQVEGNVDGNIIVGDHNFVVNTNHGTIVYKQAAPRVSPIQVAPQPPRAPRGFVNRSVEQAKLEAWIAAKEIVLLHAPDGVGKTALLKQVANSAAARAMPNGVIFMESVDVDGQALGPEDILQRLFDALFESHPRLKVNAASARTYLSNTRPLVLFDEVPLTPGLQRALPDLFPQGAIVLAADLPSGGDFQRLSIGPLPRAEALALLTAKAEIPLTDENRPTLDALCSWLGDVSLALIICGNALREFQIAPQTALQEIIAVATSEANPVNAALDRAFAFAFGRLSPEEQKILSTAALTPGISMTPEWLESALAGVGNGIFIERLKALGLLFANSPRLRLPPGFVSAARRAATVDETSVLTRLADFLLAGAEQNPQNWDFFKDELGNLSGTLTWAARSQNWNLVMRLARTLDPYLTLQGLWQRWGETLETMLYAARQTHNRILEAWALHQLGTRQIGVGTIEQALVFLRQALEIRRRLGDNAGMAYTQHNIDILIGLPPRRDPPKSEPPKPSSGGINPFLLLGALGLAGLGALALLALIIGLLVFSPPTPEFDFSPTPVLSAPTETVTPTPTLTLTATPTPLPTGVPTFTPTLTPSSSVTPTFTPTFTPSLPPAPTPFGGSGQIVFQSMPDRLQRDFYIVYALNTDGSNLRQVLRDFIPASEPVWSPDGAMLALTSRYNQNSSRQIYTVNADGSNLQQISTQGGENFAPSWSPNGRRLAYVHTSPESGSDIFSMTVNGGGLRNLTQSDGTGTYDHPAWSPDGSRIAYQALVGDFWNIFVMDADGSNPTQLTNPQTRGGSRNVEPAWSPDGRQIAFASNFNGTYDLYIMDADGSNIQALTTGSHDEILPAWSPDGRLIAFSSNDDGIFQIYGVFVDGTGLTRWTQLPGDTLHVDWLR
jgi:Tol biopolymer transport system component